MPEGAHHIRITQERRKDIDADGLAQALLDLLPLLDRATRDQLAIVGAQIRERLDQRVAEVTTATGTLGPEGEGREDAGGGPHEGDRALDHDEQGLHEHHHGLHDRDHGLHQHHHDGDGGETHHREPAA